MTGLRRLDDNLWVAEAPQRFMGLEIGARMTCVRLSDGRVLLHSPVSASPPLVQAVAAVGPVAFLVAPNRLHHLYVAEWQRTCPEAKTYAAPGLEKKRPDLHIDGALDNRPEPGWSADVDQVAVGGFPLANEVAFFHRPSRTLILTDLAFRIGPDHALLTRLVFRAIGGYGTLSPSLLEKLGVRDRAAFREGLQAIFAWPFERVIIAHGDVAETGGRAQLEASYAWVLKP